MIDCARKAISLDPDCAEAFGQLAHCHLEMRDYEEAVALSEKAVSIAPSSAENLAIACGIHCKAGNPERGLELIHKAMRACPLYRPGYLRAMGRALRLSGQPEAAIEAYRESIKREPDYLTAHVNLVSILGELGRLDEAAVAAREIYKREPNFSIKAYAAGLAYRNASVLTQFAAGLRKAGLPE